MKESRDEVIVVVGEADRAANMTGVIDDSDNDDNEANSGGLWATADAKGRGIDAPKVLRFSIDINTRFLGLLTCGGLVLSSRVNKDVCA